MQTHGRSTLTAAVEANGHSSRSPDSAQAALSQLVVELARALQEAAAEATPPPMLVDVRGAARLIGVSSGTLYRMISAGEFPEGRDFPAGIKRKGWRVDDVVAWVNEHFPSRRSD